MSEPIHYLQIEERARALLYVLGIAHDMMDEGLLDGPRIMTAQGLDVYRQMQADGFIPSQDLIDGAIRVVLGRPADTDDTTTEELERTA